MRAKSQDRRDGEMIAISSLLTERITETIIEFIII